MHQIKIARYGEWILLFLKNEKTLTPFLFKYSSLKC